MNKSHSCLPEVDSLKKEKQYGSKETINCGTI